MPPLHPPQAAAVASPAASHAASPASHLHHPPPPPPQCYGGARPTPSGAQSFDDVTTAILTQTVEEKIWPAMLADEDLAYQVGASIRRARDAPAAPAAQLPPRCSTAAAPRRLTPPPPPASQVCGDEGVRRLDFSDISGCFANNARNPRAAAVNGIAEWVCTNGARIRRVAIQTKVKYNKAM